MGLDRWLGLSTRYHVILKAHQARFSPTVIRCITWISDYQQAITSQIACLMSAAN